VKESEQSGGVESDVFSINSFISPSPASGKGQIGRESQGRRVTADTQGEEQGGRKNDTRTLRLVPTKKAATGHQAEDLEQKVGRRGRFRDTVKAGAAGGSGMGASVTTSVPNFKGKTRGK